MASQRFRGRNAFLFYALLALACLLWPVVIQTNERRSLCFAKLSTKDPDLKSELVNDRPVNFSEYIKGLRHDITHHKALDPYFIPRDHKVNPYNYSFLIDGRHICQGESPFLLIVVPSVFDRSEERKIQRETWGSVVKTGQWADGTKLPVIKLMFLFGMRYNTSIYAQLKNESLEYGDIVLADFVDSYRNLTLKSMSALYWTSRFCPDAKYLLKCDEDTLVHLPRLVKQLKQNVPSTIMGRQGYTLSVTRDGIMKKWIVSREEYPPVKYPPYILGNYYAIPKDLIAKLFHVSEYIPYLSMEDVFITGVARVTEDAGLKDLGSCLYQCKFNETYMAYVVGISRLREGWMKFSK